MISVVLVYLFLAALFVVILAKRRAIPNAQFLLPLIVLLALGFGEIAARRGLIPAPLPDNRPPDRVWQIDRYTNLLGNQDGRANFAFHGRTHPAKKQGPRVVAVGTSSTFGAGLRVNEAAWPAEMEKALRCLCPAWTGDVVNAGLTGYHSFQLMVLMREVLWRLEPDVVIFYYGVNEGGGVQPKLYHERARRLIKEHPGLDPAHRREMLKYGTGSRAALAFAHLLSRSRFVAAIVPPLTALAQKRYESRLRSMGSSVPPDTRVILAVMCALAVEHRWTLVLVPEISSTGAPINPSYAALMKEMADGYRVRFLDLSKIFPEPHARWFLDDVHPNAEGHALLGEALAERAWPLVCE